MKWYTVRTRKRQTSKQKPQSSLVVTAVLSRAHSTPGFGEESTESTGQVSGGQIWAALLWAVPLHPNLLTRPSKTLLIGTGQEMDVRTFQSSPNSETPSWAGGSRQDHV